MAVTLKGKKIEAAKKKKKLSLKAVLASPYTDYWPQIEIDEDIVDVTTVLTANLVRLLPEKCAIPWKLLKDEPRDNRKQIRESFRNGKGVTPLNVADSARNFITLGVNEVTKLLENDIAAAILVSADVNPRMLVKHVIDMAVWRKVPILVFPALKKLTATIIGCSSVCIAFKVDPENVSPYSKVVQKISELYVKFPPPEKHINFTRQREKIEIPDQSVIEVIDLDESSSEEPVRKLLLAKVPHMRVFSPPLSAASVKRKGDQLESESFISFDQPVDNSAPVQFEAPPVAPSQQKKKVSYKSLLVRTTRADPDRLKKRKKFQ